MNRWLEISCWVMLVLLFFFLVFFFVANIFEQSYRENLCKNLEGVDLEGGYLSVYPPFEEFVKVIEEETDSRIFTKYGLSEFAMASCANDDCSEFETIGCNIPANLCPNDMNSLLCYEVVLDFDYDLQDWKEWSKSVELFYR